MIHVLVVLEKSIKSVMGSEVREIETVIVGGGQAGLSVGRFLAEYKRPFVILEKNSKIGESWENKYDSLVLDSFAKYSSLEGFPFTGDPMRHAGKDEVVTYLQSFAKNYDIHPQFSTEVLKIEKDRDGFLVHTEKGVYRSKNVVLATGPFQHTHVPFSGKEIPQNIFQIHSKDYRNPAQLKPGRTLVIGGGNSGVEIVEELSSAGREVLFSYKGKLRSVRSTPLSQWLAYRHVPKDTLLGKIIIWYTKGKSVGMDVKPLLKNKNVTSVGEFREAREGKIICGESEITDISNIIWATGYKSDFSAVSIPGFDPDTQKRGVTNVPGLYVLNIRWQYSKSSSHLAGVSRDAKYIAKDIMEKSTK